MTDTPRNPARPSSEFDRSLGDKPTVQPDEHVATPSNQPGLTHASETGATFEPAVLIEVGNVVAGRFQITHKLGEGGMGLVFRGFDPHMKRDVVLKFIRRELAAQEHMVQRLMEEATSAAQLKHTHIVTLFDRGRDQHGDFLVMEYINGPNLLEVLKAAGGKLPVDRAVRYIRQVGAALQAAHQVGILHRDVKPSNVLIDGSDNAILADWGLARILDEVGHTRSGAFIGTLDYMAPEVHRKSCNASPRSDLFSLAAMLYQLVTGKSPKRIRDSLIPGELRDPLLQAMDDDPNNRHASVIEFVTCMTSSPAESASSSADRQIHTDLADLFAKMHAQVEEFRRQGRAAFDRHDYTAAVHSQQSIPAHLRDDDFLREAIVKRDRVIQLEELIKTNTPMLKLDVLRPAVDEILGLQPMRNDMQRLNEQIVLVSPSTIIVQPSKKENDSIGVLAPTVQVAVLPQKHKNSRSGGSAVNWPSSYPGDRTTIVVDGIDYAFHWCPAGQFIMGSPIEEPGRQKSENRVTVKLTRGFWLQETTVTQKQWRAVMGTEPWQSRSHVKEGPMYPATWIDWNLAIEFSAKLTVQAREVGQLSASALIALPTDAQWEFACRARTKKAFFFGNDQAMLGKFAWYQENSNDAGENHPREVGQKQPNKWGLLDMHGNVLEWCEDTFQERLIGGTDPSVTGGGTRVLRGGSWRHAPCGCRCAVRSHFDPTRKYYDTGFRLIVRV